MDHLVDLHQVASAGPAATGGTPARGGGTGTLR